MPTATVVLRDYVRRRGAYRTAKDTALQYRSVHEFLNGERSLSGPTIDVLAEYFGLELLRPDPRGRGIPQPVSVDRRAGSPIVPELASLSDDDLRAALVALGVKIKATTRRNELERSAAAIGLGV